MAKLSLPELKVLVASVVTTSLISSPSFTEARNNVVGLLDKIGKIYTLDTDYQIDKLNMFDGEYLSFGKTIEEWQEDLILPQDYDGTGANALSPDDPTYRPVDYSYSIGKKVIKTTIRNNNIERAVHNEGQLAEIVAIQFKRIEDSMAQYRYQVKREMIAKLIELAKAAQGDSTSTFAVSTAYDVGDYVRQASTGDGAKVFAVVVKPIAATNSHNWAAAVAAGELIVFDLFTKLDLPVDTNKGEAFIKAVKKDLEIASDIS